jgi:hypothetical protein
MGENMTQYRYVIQGEPLRYFKEREDGLRTWSAYQEAKCKWIISLEDQHKDKPQLTKRLKVQIYFNHKQAQKKIALSCFIKFVEDICTSIVFPNAYNIGLLEVYSITTKNPPNTTIIFTEMKNEKSNEEEYE